MALGFMSELFGLGLLSLDTLIFAKTIPTAAITNNGMLKPNTNPNLSSLSFGLHWPSISSYVD